MRNIATLVVSMMLLAAQAASPIPAQVAASSQAPASAETPVSVTVNTDLPQPLVVSGPARPDFDRDQLPKLRAWQAAQAQAAAAAAQAAASAAAAARAAAAKQITTVSAVVNTVSAVMAPATAANMLALRTCESGGNYTRNSGNGYYGAYQYDIGTWNDFDGYARADLAPASVQDAKFLITYSGRGWAPWPACSLKLGLM